jgi:hypothetical protein
MSIVGNMIEGLMQGNLLPISLAAGQEWKDKLTSFRELTFFNYLPPKNSELAQKTPGDNITAREISSFKFRL